MIIAKSGATEPMVHGYVLCVVIIRVTPRVPCQVEQELLILPDQLSSPLVCNEASFFSIFSFLCGVIQIILCLFILFHFAIVLSGIHLTALYAPLYCLTFILLLCLPHCIVWHSLYCSVYLIVLSDIHFTPLFTSL